MRFLFTFFFIIFMFQSVSFSQEWRIKNKWKISCGLVNKEALVINGKPKKTYSKNEFKVDSAIFLDFPIFPALGHVRAIPYQ